MTLAAEHRAPLTIYLSPMQPGLLSEPLLKEFQERRRETLEFLNHLGEQGSLRVLDFTDIQSFSGNPEDFYDGTHMGPANLSLLLRRLRELNVI